MVEKRKWHADPGITKAVLRILDEKSDAEGGITWRHKVAKALVKGASEGNPQLIGQLLDRVEGKVTQPVSGPGGGALPITVIEVRHQG